MFEARTAETFLSGAILDPETLLQKSSTSDEYFPRTLTAAGIIPGVKPHLKVYALPGTGGDTVMQGLDSLATRLSEYYKAGARFTKWRAPFEIDVSLQRPTKFAIDANMRDLARFALISQAEGLVPIVEPDVSLIGDHDLDVAVAINTEIAALLYHSMLEQVNAKIAMVQILLLVSKSLKNIQCSRVCAPIAQGVFMEGCILKVTNIVYIFTRAFLFTRLRYEFMRRLLTISLKCKNTR